MLDEKVYQARQNASVVTTASLVNRSQSYNLFSEITSTGNTVQTIQRPAIGDPVEVRDCLQRQAQNLWSHVDG